MTKSARVTPQKHQERVLQRIKNQKGGDQGLLLVHGLGSGKTLSSLLVGQQSGKKVSVIGPAATRTHFEAEGGRLGKGLKVNTQSYEGATKKHRESFDKGVVDTDYADDVLVFDEAHRAVGSGQPSKRQKLLKLPAHKKVLLTGTPLRNAPSDIAPLINALRPKALPAVRKDFDKKFVGERIVRPGFIDRTFRGVKPGVVQEIKNPKEFRKAVQGVVDYYEPTKEHYPSVTEESVDVELSSGQQSMIRGMLAENPALARKVYANLPPSKSESKQLAAFLTGPRAVSNTTRAYDQKNEVGRAKIDSAAAMLKERHAKDPKKFRSVVYSNYLESGVNEYADALKDSGVSHEIYHGGLSKKKRKEMVDRYNKGKINTLLISGAGSEGLDLKRTNLVQVLEPHWNSARTKQVIGRAVRYKSHDGLPDDKQHVHVQRFYGVGKRKTGPLAFLGIGKKKDYSTDKYLQELSDNKDALNKQFLDQIMAASDKGMKKQAALSAVGRALESMVTR